MTISALKAQAKNLRAALALQGVSLTHSQTLEAVAQQYGQDNWDTLAGLLKKPLPAKAPPTLADLPGVPDVIKIEYGSKSQWFDIANYDEDAIALLHRPAELAKFLEDNPNYPLGADQAVLETRNVPNGQAFTIAQLQSGEFASLGGVSYWHIPADDTNEEFYLSFAHDESWDRSPPKPDFELRIPEVVKSVKGVRTIQLQTSFGAFVALVPAHFDYNVIGTKLEKALQALDEQGPTEGAIKQAVESLGCSLRRASEDKVITLLA